MKENLCKVCGWDLKFPPWGVDGQSPTYEICPCCGVEFGNEDYCNESLLEYRENWLKSGAEWFSLEEKPYNWNLSVQLKNIEIGNEYGGKNP